MFPVLYFSLIPEMIFRHNVDMTSLEEGLLLAWCWEAAGMEGDKALGSPECPLGSSKAVSCKVFTIKRTESAEDRAGSHTPEALEFSESREQPLLEGWHGGHPGWDHLLSCFCSAQGWQVPVPPPFTGQVIPARALWMIQQPEGCRAPQRPAHGTPRTGTSSH